ncbi:MAG TPA: hypothetical protein VFI02_14215 [Armatimonadota bacterium]|nr:hypothetical protein [Armatimonadota bacterium]
MSAQQKQQLNWAKVLFGLLLIAVVSVTQYDDIFAGQVVIIGSGDLPYTTVAEDDTIRFDASRISSATNGILINHDGVLIDFDGDTLEYCTGGTDDRWGISTAYDRITATVRGGYLLFAGDSTTDNAIGIYVESADDFLVDSMTVTAGGFNAKGIWYIGEGAGYGEHENAHVRDSRIISNSNGFPARDDLTSFGIKMQYPYDGTTWPDYHLKVERTYVYSTYTGIMARDNAGVTGGLKVIFDSDSVVIDARNDLYSYPSGNDMQSTANAVGIAVDYAGPGSQISNNVVLADSAFAGCDIAIGLQFSLGGAGEANDIDVYNNVTNTHRGFDSWYGHLNCKGVKWRGNNEHVHFYDNDITVSADGDDETPWRGPSAYACNLMFVYYEGPPDSFLIVENNSFTAIDVDGGSIYAEDGGVDSAAGTGCAAYRLESAEEESGNWTMFTHSLFRYNTATSDHVTFSISSAQYDGAAHNWYIQGDTVVKGDNARDDFKVYQYGWGSKGGGGIGSRFIDIIYENGASPDDSEFVSGASQADYRLVRTLNIYVKGSNGLPVVGADVWAVNAYGDTVLQAVTDSGGLATDPDTLGTATVYQVYDNHVVVRFVSQTETDSTAFGPFVLGGQYDADSTENDSYVVSLTAPLVGDTLTLSLTAGTGEWEDAPAEESANLTQFRNAIRTTGNIRTR